jgi:hypothetical protein
MKASRNGTITIAILIATCAGQVQSAPPQGRRELIYSTGFENGARIVPAHTSSGETLDDLIDGKNGPKHSEFGGLRFHYEGGGERMRYARVVEEKGNPSNRVVHFWANQANAKHFIKVRIQADVTGVGKGFKEIYQSVRFYLPADMELLTSYPAEITWLTIMEVWNNSPLRPFPFRVTVGLHKPAKGKDSLYFHAEAQDVNQTQVKKAKFSTIWEQLNRQFKVPFGKWMTLEYYVAEGDKKRGHFFMAVTPEGGKRAVLFDITNFTHHTQDPAPNGFSTWNPLKLYTSKQLVDYMRGQGKALEAYWDDVSIWKGL